MTNRNGKRSIPSSINRVRIQVLTPRIIRIEFAEDGIFEDRLSLSRISRKCLDAPEERDGEWREIKTSFLRVRYAEDGNMLSKGNLQVRFGPEFRQIWTPGLKNEGSLKGTARTLDNASDDVSLLDNGFLSRDGWSFIDDSLVALVDTLNDGSQWVSSRKEGRRCDWYFIVCNNEYRETLKEVACVFGQQPLPPRFTLGYWWSRYWAFTDREIEQLISEFDNYSIPIDVLVMDMDWHKEGWTGYTWDKRYFPDPTNFLHWAHSKGLKVSLNLHPADGVARHEDAYQLFRRDLNSKRKRTERIQDGKTVPFDCADPDFMQLYFSLLLHPEEERGIDFWWMDWQQGTTSKIPGLDPLPWLNRLHFEDMSKRHGTKRRPLIFSRYGGVGANRYPIGFSGDTYSEWSALRFQPYFTATAANALYGYWSHDIGGHLMGEIEPELYVRWVQFGMLSPILRTHTAKNELAERRFWAYPEPYSQVLMDTVRRRYSLVPYIYTENRRCFDNAISLCYPLYYDYPDVEEAYQFKGQYCFGKSLIAAPVTHPSDPETGLATTQVWIPDGKWLDLDLGVMVQGPCEVEARYFIDEIPLFARAGAIIPHLPSASRLNETSYPSLDFHIIAGADGAYELYEDDGKSQNYQKNAFSLVPISQTWTENRKKAEIVIGAAQGHYRGYYTEKEISVSLPQITPPDSVTLNGRPLKWVLRDPKKSWSYDGEKLTIKINCGPLSLHHQNRVTLKWGRSIPPDEYSALPGFLRRMREVTKLVHYGSTGPTPYGQERLFVEILQTGNRLSRQPMEFERELKSLKMNTRVSLGVISALERGGHSGQVYFQKASYILDELRSNPRFNHFFDSK